jgi:transposase
VTHWDVNQFVFVDEMGSNISLARGYGRAEPGQRVVDKVPAARGENLSTVGALALDGVRAALSIPGAVDGEVYVSFVRQMLVPRLRSGEIVFMDNVPTHRMVAVKEAIRAVGAQVEFLPPYSPDFSPIENAFSKIKTILRAIGARTVRELMAALKKAFAAITPEDILGWFMHCGYRIASN